MKTAQTTSLSGETVEKSPIHRSDVVIELKGVSKTFHDQSGRSGSIKETLLSILSDPKSGSQVRALQNIDVEIAAGESLGIVGLNGSGKTTLLRLIAGIVKPSLGSVTVSGRIVGMIQLGAGFHQDLTGEENVRLQATLHGLTRKQIAARIDLIFDYAELQNFRSTQIKFYSSGMIARLGFAIAIHCDPEILLIDEVLAVGDQSFQERCLRTISELHRSGTTIIFVTHQMEFAERVCDRILWLRSGAIHRLGDSLEVLQAYLAETIQQNYSTRDGWLNMEKVMLGSPGRFGTGEAQIDEVRILDRQNRARCNFQTGESFSISVSFSCNAPLRELECWFILDFEDGSNVASWRNIGQVPPSGKGTFRLMFDSPPFLPGTFILTTILTWPHALRQEYDMFFRVHRFSIESPQGRSAEAPILLRPALRKLTAV